MRRRLGLLLVPLLVAAACGGADDDVTTSETGEDETEGVDLDVELLSAGAGPVQVLRLAPPEDCHQPVRQTMRLEQRISAQGEVHEATSVFENDITYDCASVDDGRIEVTMTYDDMRVLEDDSGAESSIDEMAESIIGSKGRLLYDDRGQVIDVDLPDIDIPDGGLGPVFAKTMEEMVDQMESSVDQSVAPFPQEAIGVGGHFRVAGELEVAGLTTRYSTEYLVVEIDGSRVVADTVSTVEFPPGPVDLPGMSRGAAVEIVSGQLTGTGQTTWDLGGVVAYEESEMEGTTVMRFEADGETFEMEQFQRQVLTVEPR